jgi:hypothetical protein
MSDQKFSRREAGLLTFGAMNLRAGALIAAGVTAGAAVGAPTAVQARTPDKLPTDPKEVLDAIVRTNGTSGSKRITWKTRTTVYAVQSSGVIPLVRARGSSSGWWTKKDDSTWIRYSSTLSMFEDLDTGRFLDEFTNPLNGHVGKVGVSFNRHKEGEYFTTMGNYYGSMKKAFPDSYPDEPLHADWDLDAGIVRLRSTSNFPPILKQPTRENVTHTVRAAELFDPKVETPQATVTGWNIRPWEPWLGMGDAPGHVIWHFDGVKLIDAELLDRDYLERARAYTPLFDKSPQFDEGPSFFERVLENRRKSAS